MLDQRFLVKGLLSVKLDVAKARGLVMCQSPLTFHQPRSRAESDLIEEIRDGFEMLTPPTRDSAVDDDRAEHAWHRRF